jgi:hypothetical protein
MKKTIARLLSLRTGKYKYQDVHVYIWLCFLGIITYGILIPVLGFYWDDLAILFAYESNGPGFFPEFLASDRPFSAWIFMVTTWLFGFNPLPYHILALLLRIFSAILFYHILKIFFSKKFDFLTVSSSIFLVYPGFLQQPIAVIYNHHFSVLCFFFISILLMLKNAQLKKRNPWYSIFSYITALHMFSIENFALLELIRPFLLWLVIKNSSNNDNRVHRLIKNYIPYLLIYSIFIYWRVFIFSFPTYQPGFLNSLKFNPITAVSDLIKRIPKDFLTVIVRAWTETFAIPKISDFGRTATFAFWILFAAITLCTVFIVIISKKNSSYPQNKETAWVFLFSLLLFLLGGAIVWVLDFPFRIEFAWDRLTLAFLPSVSLFIGGVYLLIRKVKLLPIVFVALLISSAASAHFQNGMTYKRDWESFQDFLWQLTWRIPSIEKGTALLGSAIDLSYYSDNSLTAPLNMTFSSDISSEELEYLFIYTGVRLNSGLPALEKDQRIKQNYRSFTFTGNTSNIIALMYNPPACLKVMDRVLSNSITNPNLTMLQVDELKLSNLSLVRQKPENIPFDKLITGNPDTSWCYYFERADLARQFQQYNLITDYGNIALNKGLIPRDASEWLPFLEGYIYTGDWEKAITVGDMVFQEEGNYENGLCYTMKRILQNTDFLEEEDLEELIKRYNC